MEYADEDDIAHTIKENLKRRLRFDESTLWEWIIQLLEGLKYLHNKNVSKLAKNNMASFSLSPEIVKDQPYDYKCDI